MKRLTTLLKALRNIEDDGFAAMVADLIDAGRTDLREDAELFLRDNESITDALNDAVLALYAETEG